MGWHARVCPTKNGVHFSSQKTTVGISWTGVGENPGWTSSKK